MSSSTPALFDFIHNHLTVDAPIIPVTKATLVHLSHTLEDIVLSERIPAMIFTGFQESTYWRQETARYRALAGVAKQVTIFAGQPLPPDSSANSLHIELADGDSLRQEWFLAILSDRFSVVLCGQDTQAAVDREGLRLFNTLWSFAPPVIDAVLNLLEEAIDRYQPDKLPALRQARAAYTLAAPDPALVTHFTAEIIQFEERLLGQLQATTSALRRSETRYRSVVTNAPVITLAADTTGRLTLIEGSRADLLVAQPSALMGRPVSSVLPDTPAFATGWQQALAGTEIITEMQVAGADLELHFTPVYDDDRRITGAVCVAVDITTRRQADEARLESERLQVALEKEHELSQTKGQIMTTISHEFRTPLAIINASVDLLDVYGDRLSPTQRQDRLENVRTQVARMGDMLDDIAVLVQDATETLDMQFAPVDIAGLARDMVDTFQRGFGSEHRMLCKRYGDLDNLLADSRLLNRILHNLLLNAIRYSPAGSEVQLDVRRSGGMTIFVISDQGIGIPPEDQNHIFEPFYRGGNIGTTRGTGVGLAIVKTCVTAHGGHISVVSEPGVGSVFTVHIPMQTVL